MQKCPSNEHPRMKQCKANRNVQFEGGVTYNWIYDPYYSSGWANQSLFQSWIVQFVLPTLNHYSLDSYFPSDTPSELPASGVYVEFFKESQMPGI